MNISKRCLYLLVLVILASAPACTRLLPTNRCLVNLLSPTGIKAIDVSKDNAKLLILYGRKPSGESTFALIDLQTRKIEKTFDLPSTQDPEYSLNIPLDIYAAEFDDNPNSIIYVSGRSIKKLDLASNKVAIVEPCPNCIAVTMHNLDKKASLQSHQSSSNTVNLVISGESAKNMQIAENAINQPMSFSPDGLSLAYSTDVFSESVPLTNSQSFTATIFNTRVFVYNETDKATYQTASDAIFKPVWLDNETLLAPDQSTMRLWRLNVATGAKDLYMDIGAVTHQQGRIAGLTLSPNGRYLIYQLYTDVFEDLYVLDIPCVKQSGQT